jgi:hypothetical protein
VESNDDDRMNSKQVHQVIKLKYKHNNSGYADKSHQCESVEFPKQVKYLFIFFRMTRSSHDSFFVKRETAYPLCETADFKLHHHNGFIPYINCPFQC